MPKKYPKGTKVRIYNRDPKSNAVVLHPELEKYHDQIGKVINVKDLGMVWEEHHRRSDHALGGKQRRHPISPSIFTLCSLITERLLK